MNDEDIRYKFYAKSSLGQSPAAVSRMVQRLRAGSVFSTMDGDLFNILLDIGFCDLISRFEGAAVIRGFES